jgi:hypothetical protein
LSGLCLWLAIVVALPARAAAEPLRPHGSTQIKAHVEQLVLQAKRLKLADQRMWWRLMRYRAGWFGVTSEVDGGPFFNSPDGRTDPEAELAATLRAFFSPGPDDQSIQHPFCRFPARLAWLNAHLHFDFEVLPRQSCPRFDEFRAKVDPESISLIFSSYFLNNPASAFGHTLLRINKKRSAEEEERQALLDYGVNFGATVDTGNAVMYALKGLLGLFAGEFTKVPYYFKVREYNDYESRDLWEFELELERNEVQMAVAHIWELGSALFAYYYMSENCSYHMLGILEVASPRVDLLSKLGWPVIPADTLQAVAANPGLVRSVTYRPSTRVQFRHRLERLDPRDVDLVFRLGGNPDAALPPGLSRERQMHILDTALDLADFRFSKQLLDPTSAESAFKQRLLSRRAGLRVPSPPLSIPGRALDNPLLGHDVGRWDLGQGHSSRHGFYQALDLRLALHDWSDPSAGYPETLSINFLPLRLRYYVERQRLELEEASLVSITSLVPLDLFDRSMSWNARAGVTRIHDAGCADCLVGMLEAGGGIAVGAFEQGLLLFANLNTALMGLGPIQGGIADLPLRAGVGPKAGLRLRFAPELIGVLRADWLYLPVQTPNTTWLGAATLRWMYVHNFALSLEAQIHPNGTLGQLASSLYF